MRIVARNLALLATVVSLTLAAATATQAATSPAAAATTLCSKLQVAVGADTFGALLGSSDACAARVVTAYNACKSSGVPRTAAFQSCAEAQAVTALKQLVGSGKVPQLLATASKLTQNVCTTLQTKNGARFAKVFTNVAGCESKLTSIAQSTIQTCLGGSGPVPACVRSALQSAAASLRLSATS